MLFSGNVISMIIRKLVQQNEIKSTESVALKNLILVLGLTKFPFGTPAEKSQQQWKLMIHEQF